MLAGSLLVVLLCTAAPAHAELSPAVKKELALRLALAELCAEQFIKGVETFAAADVPLERRNEALRALAQFNEKILLTLALMSMPQVPPQDRAKVKAYLRSCAERSEGR